MADWQSAPVLDEAAPAWKSAPPVKSAPSWKAAPPIAAEAPAQEWQKAPAITDAPVQPAANQPQDDSKLPQADSTTLLNPAALHQQPALPVEDVSKTPREQTYGEGLKAGFLNDVDVVHQQINSNLERATLSNPGIVATDEQRAGAAADYQARNQELAARQRPIADPGIREVAPMVPMMGIPIAATVAGGPAAGAIATYGQISGDIQNRAEQKLRHDNPATTPLEAANKAMLPATLGGAAGAAIAAIPGGNSVATNALHATATGYGFDLSDQLAMKMATGEPIDWKRFGMSGLTAGMLGVGIHGVKAAGGKALHAMFKGEIPPEHVDALAKAESPEQIEQVVNNARAKLAQATLPVNEQIRGKIEGATDGKGTRSDSSVAIDDEAGQTNQPQPTQAEPPNAVGSPSSAAPTPAVDQRVLENQPGREAAGLPGNGPSGESSPVAQPPASPLEIPDSSTPAPIQEKDLPAREPSTGATPIDPLEPVVSKAERDILSAPLDETPEPPKLDTAAGDGGEKPLTTGIAQRVTNIEAGQGIAPEAAVEQGRKLLASGADPNTAFDDSRPLDESLGLARAHEEVLAKAANRAADEHGVSSSEYRAANKEQMAWREKIKPLQTRWSRAGAVQQGETEIDTGTFHGLHQAYQERTGKEFTPAQAESAKRTAAEVKQKNDAADAAKQKLYDAVGSSEASPQTKSLADRIVAKLDKAADDALARFRKRHTATVTSGVDPADLADLSIYGAAKIAKGVTRFAEWSAEMVKDVGESIRPHLQAIFDASDKELDRHVAGESAHEENVQRSKTKPLGKTATPEEIGKRLSDKSTPGQLSIIAKHLSRVFIRDGITERDANVDAVHKVISGRIPEFTREQTSDAMSGYGDFRRLSKDPIEVRRREISGEIQQVRKLQDMSEGKAPKKSGVERQAPTDEARRLTAQVNEAKKRGGYTTTDPTTQLKSALDARKTWTRNRMADMRREIAAGVKDAKTRGAGPSDPELVKLRTEYEKVKADYLATFGEPSRKMTDAQRLKAATTSAERSLEDLQRRVNESDFSTDNRKPVSSPKLESIRAKVDEVRAQLAELKGLDPASMQTAAQKSDAAWLRKLTSDHAKLTARLSDPSLSDVGKKSRVTFDPEVQAAQDRNNAIREQIASNKGAAVTAEKAKAATDLIRSHPAGTKMTPERVRALWADAKTNYIEKGVTNFDDIVNKLATDHGLPVNDIRRGLAQPKGAREITNEMYAKQADARRTIQNAKQWVQNAGKPRLQRGLEALPRLFFTAKVFGHGTVGMITHAGNQIFNPGEARSYWTNFARQFKLMGVHDAGAFHEQAMADLQRRPNYVTARRAGLVNDPTKFADDYQKTSVAKFLGKIGLTGSRGFDALKLFRQDLFDHQWDGLPASLKTPDMAKEIADSANHATGTVKANVGGKVATAAVFAPKLEGSRWAFLVGDPAKAAKRFANWKNETPEARSSAIREVKQKAIIAGTYFGALAINQAMLSATGSSQKVNFTDPTKPDFLGFKVAGHNVSVVSPMIGTVRFLSDLARFPFESRKDLRGDEPLGAAGERSVKYLRGKLSPFAKPIADTYSGSDYSGRPMPWSNSPVPKYLQREGVGKISYGEYAAETVLPIPVESAIKEAWKSQGMSDNDIARWMKAITVGAVEGSTGARVSQDEPQPTPPQKHIASPSRSGFLHVTKPARAK